MYHRSPDMWKDLLLTGLSEDGWPWDWTSLGSQPSESSQPTKPIHARIIAKAHGIWAAEDLVRAFNRAALEISIATDQPGKHSSQATANALSKIKDGHAFQPGEVLVEFTGSARDLLALERPFLNIAAYVCGIATATHRVVQIVEEAYLKNRSTSHGLPRVLPRVSMTRKTLPGYRDVAIHGVRAGGGFPHRVSLAGGILIKENHIAAAGGIAKSIEGVRAIAPHGLKVEIEVRNLSELQEALNAKAEGVLLDNFTKEEVQAALKLIASQTVKPFVEVSGGLSESTISDYAVPGVDVLSMGSLTHSVTIIDLSFLVI